MGYPSSQVGAQSGSAAVSTSRYPWVRNYSVVNETLATIASEQTNGWSFTTSESVEFNGAELWWKWFGSGADTVLVRIWNNAGTLLATATFSITKDGYYTRPFDNGPITLPVGTYTIGAYAGAAKHNEFATARSSPLLAIQYNELIPAAINLFLAGNGRPTGGAGTARYTYMAPY